MVPTMLWLTLSCTRAPATCDPLASPPAQARAAGCVLVSDRGLLMVRTVEGWSIPAGSIEPGETTSAAASRETLEEAGVAVSAGEVACVATERAFVAHFCAPDDPDTQPRPDGIETREARYVGADELASWPSANFRFPEQAPQYRAFLTR